MLSGASEAGVKLRMLNSAKDSLHVDHIPEKLSKRRRLANKCQMIFRDVPFRFLRESEYSFGVLGTYGKPRVLVFSACR